MESVIAGPTPAPPGIGPKPWGIPAIIVGLALPLTLLGLSLAVAVSQGSTQDLSDGEVATSFIFTIILDIILVAIAAGLALWRYRLGWREFGLRPLDRSFWWYPLIAAAGAHLFIIIYSVTLEIVGLSPPSQELDDLFKNPAILPLAFVSTVLVAPIAEEVFFRSFIFAGLVRPLGLAGAVVVSGLLFGLFHVQDAHTVGLILPFGAIGMLFAWLYNRTGSLLSNILTHLLFNLVSFIFLASLAGGG